jgi:hypothetical protein
MAQLTIFRYRDDKPVVIFGWEFPGHRFGQTFISGSDKLVSYFEAYFDHHFSELSYDTRETAMAGASLQGQAPVSEQITAPRRHWPIGTIDRVWRRLRRS